MSNDDIITMARASGFKFAPAQFSGVLEAEVSEFDVEAFAALVAAKEREACAKVCETKSDRWAGANDDIASVLQSCAGSIRSRGNP